MLITCHPTRVSSLLGLALLATTCASQRSFPAKAGSNSPILAANRTTDAVQTNATSAFTIELYSTRVRFENDGTGKRQLDVCIRIASDSGAQALHSLSFDYNASNESFSLNFLRVTKKDGSVVEARQDAVQDQPNTIAEGAPAFSNMRNINITVPALAAGDMLSYEVVTRTLKPIAPGEFWYAHNFLTNPRSTDEVLRIDLPSDRVVQVRSQSPFVPEIMNQGTRRIYSWKRSDTEQKIEKNSSPENFLANDAPGSSTPDVMLTSFTNWPSLGAWLGNVLQGAAAQTAEITAKAQTLTSSEQSGTDKLAVIYDFVSKQIRLVPVKLKMADFHARDAAQVLSDGYGDEFDKCALLLAMSNAVGFHGDVAIEPSGGKFDAAFPFPDDLAHAIVAVNVGKETLWLNPSSPVGPFRYLTPNLRGKQALIASEKNHAQFDQTPADPPFLSTQNVDITGRVTSLGKLTAHIRYALRGDNEYALRMAFYSAPKDKWKQVAQTMATLDGLRGEVVEVSSSDPTATKDPFILDFDIVDPEFLDWSRSQVALALPLPTFGLPDAPADASKPIELGSPLDVTTSLALTLPVTDSAQAPVGSGVSRDFAEYQSQYEAKERVITAERKLRFLSHQVPAARAADYGAFTRTVQADEGHPVLVTNIIPDVPADAAPLELMDAGAAALKSQNYPNALRLFRRVRELKPKQPGLWNELGLAQLQLGRYEDAATSFRNQLAASPADESANSLLGVALFDEKKYDESVAAFQKVIILKPLDSNAYTYLGAVYIQQKKYLDAVSQLEKAAVLNPDDASIRLRLGQAYFGLGNSDSALSAFEKAAAISPTPAFENEIAYSLAQHNVALDRAQHYAELALESTESQLRNLDLEHLTKDQIIGVTFLAPIWDTLGWVYFQQGNLARAESYIRPSWQLDERGDVGDHLAQIYKKRGDKILAIRTYLLALAVGGAPAESRVRLAKLLGSESDLDARVKRVVPELLRMRTIPLGKPPADGKAAFLLCVASGQSGTVVREAKFLGGTEALASLGKRIKTSQFPELSPPNSKARVILRGIATCSAKTPSCEFVFDRPSQLLAQR